MEKDHFSSHQLNDTNDSETKEESDDMEVEETTEDHDDDEQTETMQGGVVSSISDIDDQFWTQFITNSDDSGSDQGNLLDLHDVEQLYGSVIDVQDERGLSPEEVQVACAAMVTLHILQQEIPRLTMGLVDFFVDDDINLRVLLDVIVRRAGVAANISAFRSDDVDATEAAIAFAKQTASHYSRSQLDKFDAADDSWFVVSRHNRILLHRSTSDDPEQEQKLRDSFKVTAMLMDVAHESKILFQRKGALITRNVCHVFDPDADGSFHHVCGLLQRVIQSNPEAAIGVLVEDCEAIFSRIMAFLHHSPVPDALVQLVTLSHLATAAGGAGRAAAFRLTPSMPMFSDGAPGGQEIGPHLFKAMADTATDEARMDLWHALTDWGFFQKLSEHIWEPKYAVLPGHYSAAAQAFIHLLKDLRNNEHAKMLFKCFRRTPSHESNKTHGRRRSASNVSTSSPQKHMITPVEGLARGACSYVPIPMMTSSLRLSSNEPETNQETGVNHHAEETTSQGVTEESKHENDVSEVVPPQNVDMSTPAMMALSEIAHLAFQENVPVPSDQPPPANPNMSACQHDSRNFLRSHSGQEIASDMVNLVPQLVEALVTLHKTLHPKLSVAPSRSKSSRRRKKQAANDTSMVSEDSKYDCSSLASPQKDTTEQTFSPTPHPRLSNDVDLSIPHPGRYVATVPFGAYRLAAVELLVNLVEYQTGPTLDAIAHQPELIGCLMAWYLEYPHSNMYHHLFYRFVMRILQYGYVLPPNDKQEEGKATPNDKNVSSQLIGHQECMKLLFQSYKLVTHLINVVTEKHTSSAKGDTLRLLNAIRLVASASGHKSFLATHLRDHPRWNAFADGLRTETLRMIQPLVPLTKPNRDNTFYSGLTNQLRSMNLRDLMSRITGNNQNEATSESAVTDMGLGSKFADDLGFSGWVACGVDTDDQSSVASKHDETNSPNRERRDSISSVASSSTQSKKKRNRRKKKNKKRNNDAQSYDETPVGGAPKDQDESKLDLDAMD